jgi:calcineurin-like phosphoesterase family protein
VADIWFTSDTHYGHANIVKYCGRPFSSVEEMDEAMIERWNRVVKPGDTVYHLGDVMMGQNMRERLATLRSRLSGHITLVLGNHDRSPGVYLAAGFERALRSITTSAGGLGGTYDVGRLVSMRHHPPKTPPNCIYLCGHVHEKWKRRGNVINVGVDQWEFTPVNFDTLLSA